MDSRSKTQLRSRSRATDIAASNPSGIKIRKGVRSCRCDENVVLPRLAKLFGSSTSALGVEIASRTLPDSFLNVWAKFAFDVPEYELGRTRIQTSLKNVAGACGISRTTHRQRREDFSHHSSPTTGGQPPELLQEAAIPTGTALPYYERLLTRVRFMTVAAPPIGLRSRGVGTHASAYARARRYPPTPRPTAGCATLSPSSASADATTPDVARRADESASPCTY